MRSQGPCDTSFESYERTDSKNIADKSRQPRDGALERFEICLGKLLFSATTGFKVRVYIVRVTPRGAERTLKLFL